MRRFRATFLLRCVILVACVLPVVGVLYLGMGTTWAVASVTFAVVLWVVGIETDLLPWAIERVVVRRAEWSGARVSSIWFVDLDQQRANERATFHDDTRDNPTLR